MLGRQPLAFLCLLHFSFRVKVFWLRHLVDSPLPFCACCTLVLGRRCFGFDIWSTAPCFFFLLHFSFRAKVFCLRHLVDSPLPFLCLLHFSFRAKVVWLFFAMWVVLEKTSPPTLPVLLRARVLVPLDKYAGLVREGSLADLVSQIASSDDRSLQL